VTERALRRLLGVLFALDLAVHRVIDLTLIAFDEVRRRR
jgi:hypothetical protein